MFVVIDLDQTIVDNTRRAAFVMKEPKDWAAFSATENVMKDTIIPGAAEALQKLQELKYDLVIVTERTEDMRDATTRWLLEKLNIALPDTHLMMRPAGNLLTPLEVKREQLLTFKQGLDNRDTGFIVIDDDQEVCAGLGTFGLVLKAPACWSVIFPEETARVTEG